MNALGIQIARGVAKVVANEAPVDSKVGKVFYSIRATFEDVCWSPGR